MAAEARERRADAAVVAAGEVPEDGLQVRGTLLAAPLHWSVSCSAACALPTHRRQRRPAARQLPLVALACCSCAGLPAHLPACTSLQPPAPPPPPPSGRLQARAAAALRRRRPPHVSSVACTRLHVCIRRGAAASAGSVADALPAVQRRLWGLYRAGEFKVLALCIPPPPHTHTHSHTHTHTHTHARTHTHTHARAVRKVRRSAG